MTESGNESTIKSVGKQYSLSLDDYIDTERLRSMNSSLEEKLNRFLKEESDGLRYFFAGDRLDPIGSIRNGTRAIRLRGQVNGGYREIHRADCWENSQLASEFPEIMKFVTTLPFTGFGRCMIIFDDGSIEEPPHRDHGDPGLTQEFIWFRTNLRKRFYIYDRHTYFKHYVESYSAWFDTRHFHGTDPADGLSLSIRVDGVFTPDFRAAIAEGLGTLEAPKGFSIREKLTRRSRKLGAKMKGLFS